MGNGDLKAAAGVHEGEILSGKYRVERVLGVGGMGIVVAAWHMQLDTRVALKFLHPAAAGSEEAVSRFAREARAAVKITGHHVARILDVATLENGAPYMVMEFLEGADLAAWVQDRGPLPVEQAVDFVLQACVALAEAHSLGIVHRDLKPANLFCVRRADGQLLIKVLDFGISKMTSFGVSHGPSRSGTQTSAIMGSPLYMSPEQMTSARNVDTRTDVWAVGVILHELISGSAPFQGDTLPEICVKVATASPPPLRMVRRDAPAGVEAIILKCLEKDREARYRNVGEVAVALAPFGPARCHVLVDAIRGILRTQETGASSTTATGSISLARGGGQTLIAGTIPTFGWTNAGTSARKAWGRRIGAGMAVITVAAIAVFAFLRSSATAPAPRPASAGLSFSAPPNETRMAEPAETLLAPAPVVADVPSPRAAPTLEEAPPSAPAPASPIAATPKPLRRHAAASAAPSSPSGSAVALPVTARSVGCDPPFFIDDQGSHVFKKECVH